MTTSVKVLLLVINMLIFAYDVHKAKEREGGFRIFWAANAVYALIACILLALNISGKL